MIEKEILQALQSKVIAAVALSTVPTLPIAFVDVAFDPPNNGKYLELVHITNNPADPTWNEEEHHRGMLRFILHWPNNGGGAYTPLMLLASISSQFRKDEKIAGLVTVLNKPKAMSKIANGQENLYPASVEYSVFTLA